MAPGLQTHGQRVAHRNSSHSYALDNPFRFIDGMTKGTAGGFAPRLLVEAEAGCCRRATQWLGFSPDGLTRALPFAHSPPLVIPTGAKRSGGMIKGRGVAFSLRWLTAGGGSVYPPLSGTGKPVPFCSPLLP